MARSKHALILLRHRIPVGERVLDLGCGFGLLTARLAQHYDTYAVDSSPYAIQVTRRRAPTAHVHAAAAARLPYPDDYFAAVVLLDVLEHVRYERAVLREVARVLRPGGLLVLSVPHAGWLRWLDALNLYAWLTGENPLAHPGAPRDGFVYHRHYALGALSRLVSRRFTIQHVRYSALGLHELLHLVALLVGKRLLRSAALYQRLVGLYYTACWHENDLSMNEGGYSVMIEAYRGPVAPGDGGATADAELSPLPGWRYP